MSTNHNERITVALRIEPELHLWLKQVAEENDVSMNWIVTRILRRTRKSMSNTDIADVFPEVEVRA